MRDRLPQTLNRLLLRGGVWHIDKIMYGKRICESTGTRGLSQAEALLARRSTKPTGCICSVNSESTPFARLPRCAIPCQN